ncbi:MAG: hypothetical protein BGN88_13895 [Clostridiales bacterium 43-6]|nr:MAG: hypothetical protein BGN88_13895 [Clostridiales bacterium 43-6]
MRSKRFIIALLTFVIVFTAIGTPRFGKSAFIAEAKTESDYKKDLAKSQQKSKELQQEINKLAGQIGNKQAQINKVLAIIDSIKDDMDMINGEITKLNAKIKDAEQKIKAKEIEIENKTTLFKERLRAMYVSGGNTELQVLLSTSDFADFLAKMELISSVSEKDNKMIDDLKKDLKVINEDKAKLEEDKESNKRKRDDMKDRQKNYSTQLAVVQKAIDEAKDEKKTIEEERAEELQKQREIKADIAELKQKNTYTGTYGGGLLAWPVPGYYTISSGYGPRGSGFHPGVDITGGGVYGHDIVAAADGVVVLVKYSSTSYGNRLYVGHGKYNGKELTTLYAHCSRIMVSSGQTVKKGQKIAEVGSTGNSTGPHLHFEVILDGDQVNPMGYLK